MLIENTYANNIRNFRRHLKQIYSLYNIKDRFGINRFEALLHAMDPNIQELEKLVEIFRNEVFRYIK
jgi:hypothetical protein